MKSFLAELSRRKVWLFGGIYLALGWVLLQVAVVVESTMKLPDWIDQSALVLLVLGFPVALLLAWAQESQSVRAEKVIETDAPSRLALAVLPFADMSPEGDQDWFSDGISEEILHRLAGEKELSVAGRTSSFHFKGRSASFVEIGAMLNVGSVLEGSVRKTENRLRITAQLIDVKTGYHIWSGTFDRELEDIFRIQEDISEAIATALLREIGVEPSLPEAKLYEPNVEAWQAYLRGKKVWNQTTPASMAKGAEYYLEAARLDENFLEPLLMVLYDAAFVRGTGAYSRTLGNQYDAKNVKAMALARNPTSAQRKLIAALYAFADWQFQEADRIFTDPELANSDDRLTQLAYGGFMAKTNRFSEADQVFSRLLISDPLDLEVIVWRIFAVANISGLDAARAYIQDLEDLGITNRMFDLWSSRIAVASGNLEAAEFYLQRELAVLEIGSVEHLGTRLGYAHFKKETGRVEMLLDILLARAEDDPAGARQVLHALAVIGRHEEAAVWLRRAIDAKDTNLHFSIAAGIMFPEVQRFLTRDPRGRALIEEAGYDLAWFDEPEGGQ